MLGFLDLFEQMFAYVGGGVHTFLMTNIRAEKIAALRGKIAELEAGSSGARPALRSVPLAQQCRNRGAAAAGVTDISATSGQVEGDFTGYRSADVVGVPAGIAMKLPAGGLVRRQAVDCSDCPGLVIELIAHISASGARVAVVGWPQLSLAQVAESGDLSRIIVVPDPGAQPWDITAVLVEGLDLVIHYGPAPRGAQARALQAKLRRGRAALLTVGGRLPGSAASIYAQPVCYRGLGRGSGRIRQVEMDIQVAGAHKQLAAVSS